jgi:hypothetical protein
MLGPIPNNIRLGQGIAVVAAAAAFIVPTASASQIITDTLAPGGTSTSGSYFITDTLAPGGSAVPAAGYRIITDTLAPGGGAGAETLVPGSGFSWADAGIGAAVMCGLTLLALMGRQLAARRRRGQLAY